MNSSAFIPTQYASPASPSTSSGTFYEGNTPSHCSFSCPDGFVAPQPSSWSDTPLLGWSYADSELRSPAISDVELYGTFLTGELAYTNAFSNEPCIDSFIHPGTLHALAHDPTHDALLHTSPLDHGYAFSAQSDAFYPSVPMDSTHKQTYPIAAPQCIAPTLIESPACSEREFSPSDDEIASYVEPQHVHPTRASHRVDIRASSDSLLPSPYPSPSPELYPHASSELIACRRRNAPAFPSTTTSSNRWKCPHCPYVQRNRRSPDLKRHVETHTRGAHVAVWVCCGVPVETAVELGVPPEVVRAAPLFDFDGVTMVGGCRKVFSRRDALIRHLRKRKGACYGNAGALYQPGNRDVMVLQS